jgi:hypothetical protein
MDVAFLERWAPPVRVIARTTPVLTTPIARATSRASVAPRHRAVLQTAASAEATAVSTRTAERAAPVHPAKLAQVANVSDPVVPTPVTEVASRMVFKFLAPLTAATVAATATSATRPATPALTTPIAAATTPVTMTRWPSTGAVLFALDHERQQRLGAAMRAPLCSAANWRRYEPRSSLT